MNYKEWPVINYNKIQDTLETLHQWIQIIGKIRLNTMPWQNHSWHAPLYLSPKGFTTNPIPYKGIIFQIDLDFKRHKLIIESSNMASVSMDLYPRTVSDFYNELYQILNKINIDVKIHPFPNEIEPAVHFNKNQHQRSYDKEAINTIWQAMVKANEVFSVFRSNFIGKAGPVHLFWGGFDLAVTRFSGNDAPLYNSVIPNIPLDVMQEAYSKEVSSAGFWLGSKNFPTPVFYSYAYPGNAFYSKQIVQPIEAFWNHDLGEYLIKYEDIQKAENPNEKLMEFLNSTYDAAANTGSWNRNKLEKNNYE